MTFAQASARMPKLMGLLACGPAALLGDAQDARFFRNFTATDDENEACSEPSSPSALRNSNSNHADLTLKQNSAVVASSPTALQNSNSNNADLILKRNSAVVASNLYGLRVQQAASKAKVAHEHQSAGSLSIDKTVKEPC